MEKCMTRSIYDHKKRSIDDFRSVCARLCMCEIIEKKHLRDLGVTMSNNAAFKDNISNISRASTFQTQNRTAMLTLWKSFVIQILDFC